MDRHLPLATARPVSGGDMSPQEHALQLSAVRASLLTDSSRFTHHDVSAARTAETNPVAATRATLSEAG